MSKETNKALAIAWHDAMNSPDWETAIAPFFSGDLSRYHVWFVQNHRQFRKAFPDYHATITRVVAEGDTVVVTTLVTGTHSAEFPFGEMKGIAATGKKLAWEEVTITKYRAGALSDIKLIVDGVARLQQLGVLSL
jgi:predicted ester cyclase